MLEFSDLTLLAGTQKLIVLENPPSSLFSSDLKVARCSLTVVELLLTEIGDVLSGGNV